MRSKIWMYLFLFTALALVFVFTNSKKGIDAQTKKIERLEEKWTQATDSLSALEGRLQDERYFSLQGNDNAYVYFQNDGFDPEYIERALQETIYEQNKKDGNDLIPFEGGVAPFRINKVKVLNHKWIIADFSDGKYWGEILLRYDVNEDKTFTFETIQSLVYPEDKED